MHRIGRTGRSGKTGLATTFINKTNDESVLLDLKHLLIEAKQKVPPFLAQLQSDNEKYLDLGGNCRSNLFVFLNYSVGKYFSVILQTRKDVVIVEVWVTELPTVLNWRQCRINKYPILADEIIWRIQIQWIINTLFGRCWWKPFVPVSGDSYFEKFLLQKYVIFYVAWKIVIILVWKSVFKIC